MTEQDQSSLHAVDSGLGISSGDDVSLDDYRSVSGLAVLAFLLGLVSITTFLGPLLLVLPVASLGVGLLALAKIAAGEGHLTGTRLARWGIFLAVFFVLAATVRPVLYQELLQRQAKTFTQQWLQLLAEGQVEQALQLVSADAKFRLIPRDAEGKPLIDDNTESEIAKNFEREELVEKLLAAGPSIAIDCYDCSSSPLAFGRQTVLQQTFVATNKDVKQSGQLFYIQIDLNKSHTPSDDRSAWSVGHWQLVADTSDLAKTL